MVGVAGVVRDARRARAAGADLVVVSMHWGIEYTQVPSAEQRRFAEGILASGQVDYIIGNHPHRVQPCAKIDGRLVNYSLGNQLSNQGPPDLGLPAATQDRVIVVVTFTRDAAGKITETERFRPTWVDRFGGHVVRLVTPESNPASWRRTTSVLTADGNPGHAAPIG